MDKRQRDTHKKKRKKEKKEKKKKKKKKKPNKRFELYETSIYQRTISSMQKNAMHFIMSMATFYFKSRENVFSKGQITLFHDIVLNICCCCYASKIKGQSLTK